MHILGPWTINKEELRQMRELNAALLEACKAWAQYEKECENKMGADYGLRVKLRKRASELTTKVIVRIEGRKP